RGGIPEGESIRYAGRLVQFLPPTGALSEDAICEALELEVDGVPARVFTADYCAAISLETGRDKDILRLKLLLNSGVMDMERFKAIISKHHLDRAWADFSSENLRGTR